jgi:hypothetical protein
MLIEAISRAKSAWTRPVSCSLVKIVCRGHEQKGILHLQERKSLPSLLSGEGSNLFLNVDDHRLEEEEWLGSEEWLE